MLPKRVLFRKPKYLRMVTWVRLSRVSGNGRGFSSAISDSVLLHNPYFESISISSLYLGHFFNSGFINLHAVTSTHLKCKVQWTLVYMDFATIVTTDMKTGPIPLKEATAGRDGTCGNPCILQGG